MDSFYCPDCGRDVKAPHFCPCRGRNGGGGIGVNIDVGKLINSFRQGDKPKPKPTIPQEYIDAIVVLVAKHKAGEMDGDEFKVQMSHIRNIISIWRRLNGKETD